MEPLCQDSAVPGRLVNGSEAQDSIFTACSRAGIALFSTTDQDPKHSRLQQIGTEGPQLREEGQGWAEYPPRT